MPVMLLDASERVLFVNEPMRAAAGRRRAAQACQRRAAQSRRAGGDRPHRQDRRARQRAISPCRCRSSGTIQAYTARISAAPPATALLLHDLTAIRRSEQMRADFVANASHELRTPLAAVSGFIDTLARPCPGRRGGARTVPGHHERGSGAHAPADRRSAVAHPHRAERACAARRAASRWSSVVREAAAALAPLAAGRTASRSRFPAAPACRR